MLSPDLLKTACHRVKSYTFLQKKPPSSTAGVGFAPPSSKKDSKTKRKGYEPEMDKGWFHVADAADFGEKQTKSVIMSGNQQVQRRQR